MCLLPVTPFVYAHTHTHIHIHNTAPPTIAELPGEGSRVVEAGSSFTLTCSASGWPTPHIQVRRLYELG